MMVQITMVHDDCAGGWPIWAMCFSEQAEEEVPVYGGGGVVCVFVCVCGRGEGGGGWLSSFSPPVPHKETTDEITAVHCFAHAHPSEQ